MQEIKNKHTLRKEERLSLQNKIDNLFSKGDSFIAYPLRVVYTLHPIEENAPLTSILVSVSKRKFKRAVKRNRVKRLIRENFRLNKEFFHTICQEKDRSIDIAFLYLKDELPSYAEINKAIEKTLTLLNEKICKLNEENNS